MKPKRTKDERYYVSASILKLCTLPVIGLYLIQFIYMVFSTATQWQNGSDFRPQLGYLLIYNTLPIVAFAVAYVLNPRKLSVIPKLFESLLISIAALICWSILNILVPIIYVQQFLFDQFRIYEYLMAGTFLLVYISVLFFLRKKHMWT